VLHRIFVLVFSIGACGGWSFRPTSTYCRASHIPRQVFERSHLTCLCLLFSFVVSSIGENEQRLKFSLNETYCSRHHLLRVVKS